MTRIFVFFLPAGNLTHQLRFLFSAFPDGNRNSDFRDYDVYSAQFPETRQFTGGVRHSLFGLCLLLCLWAIFLSGCSVLY